MSSHDDEINALVGGVPDDFLGGAAFENYMTNLDAVIDRPDLFELSLPIFNILVFRAGGRQHALAQNHRPRLTNVENGQAGAMSLGQRDRMEIGLIRMRGEIRRVQDVLDVDHVEPPAMSFSKLKLDEEDAERTTVYLQAR